MNNEKEIRNTTNNIVRNVTALYAYLCYTRYKCSPETCRKRIRDISDMLKSPKLFNNGVDDADYVDWCKKNLNLDIEEEINVRVNLRGVQ